MTADMQLQKQDVTKHAGIVPVAWFFAKACIVGFLALKLSAKLYGEPGTDEGNMLAFVAVCAYMGLSIMRAGNAYKREFQAKELEAVTATLELAKRANQAMINEERARYAELKKKHERLTAESEKGTLDLNENWKKLRTKETELQAMTESKQALEQEKQALQAQVQSLQASASADKSSANARIEEAEKKGYVRCRVEYDRKLQEAQTALLQAQGTISTIEEAFRLQGEVKSANGRLGKASDDERPDIEAKKEQALLELKALVEKEPWLSMLTKWA